MPPEDADRAVKARIDLPSGKLAIQVPLPPLCIEALREHL
jgi:hypothetical protein